VESTAAVAAYRLVLNHDRQVVGPVDNHAARRADITHTDGDRSLHELLRRTSRIWWWYPNQSCVTSQSYEGQTGYDTPASVMKSVAFRQLPLVAGPGPASARHRHAPVLSAAHSGASGRCSDVVVMRAFQCEPWRNNRRGPSRGDRSALCAVGQVRASPKRGSFTLMRGAKSGTRRLRSARAMPRRRRPRR
jgi:hypothetical protein